MSRKKRLGFSALLALGVLLASEAFLGLICAVLPQVDCVVFPCHQTVADEKVGHRPSPYYPGHDRRGFRNKTVPGQVQVVALGDSQTYGVSLPREDAWPQQLEILSGSSTYNMGFGGYGPAHSLILIEEAMAFKPRLVIEALYEGNDFYDCFHLVYDLGKLARLRSSDVSILESVKERERKESLQAMASRTSGAAIAESPILAASLRSFLATRSSLYGVLRALKRALEDKYPSWDKIKKYASRKGEVYQVFEGKTARAVFMPAYRLCALDGGDARILEGLRISLEALLEMNAKLAEARIGFLVVLIPTQELVFEDMILEEKVTMPDVYQLLLRQEKAMRQKCREFLEAHSIHFTDALPSLRGLLRRGQSPYPQSANGHPNRAGHHAIAEQVLAAMKEKGYFADR